LSLTPDPPAEQASSLAEQAGIPQVAAALMLQRGYRTADEVREFLEPSPARLNKPDTLPDIGPATDRILAAIDQGERVCVYGDYDVDGVCGTALLTIVLRGLGADVIYYLPHRQSEGYGLSMHGIEHCRQQKVSLLVTNDCGSTDHAEVDAARLAGIDVVITDHHEPPAELPSALAVVNPKRPDSEYPFTELAGVGVAFKLAWSLLSRRGRPRQELTDLLDLVGLGTIADVVPLVEENRILARFGLEAIRTSSRPGLRALLDRCGIAGRPLRSYDVGYILGPRLNAAGRVSHALDAAHLLLSDDEAESVRLATELDRLNRERQVLEEKTMAQAVQLIEPAGLHKQRVVVVARPGWNEGVVGIVAARLVERYHRPCFVIAMGRDKGKGSGRSISGFDLYAGLEKCAGHLLGFGGHKYAAGLTVSRDEVDFFRSAINSAAADVPEDIFQRTLDIDIVTDLDAVDPDLVDLLNSLEPFGQGNSRPVFASLGVEVVGYPRRFGKDHLKFNVRAGVETLEAVAWRRSHDLPDMQPDCPAALDICYTVERNSFRGRTGTRLNIRDMRTHQAASAGEPAD
jgi:single-stranded-DNA-specific exonuclease